METYQKEVFSRAGISSEFVQDNQSKSKKGVLRGLHFQRTQPQGKLVRVIKGEVFDVAVDLRSNSSTYGKWVGVILSSENKKQFYIPEVLLMDFWFYLMKQSLHINVLIIIRLMMKMELSGMMKLLVLSGL